MARRTVMYSSKGKKLYAVRDKGGKFKDIQQYSRAHAQDIKRGSSAETKAAAKLSRTITAIYTAGLIAPAHASRSTSAPRQSRSMPRWTTYIA